MKLDNASLKICLGDAFEEIKKIEDHSINLILTDPPYNLGQYSTGNIKLTWRKDFNNDIAHWDNTTFDPSAWLTEFKRVLSPKGNIFAFTSYNLLGKWHEVFDPEFDTFQFFVWHKTNPPPKLYKTSFLNSCELIVCCWNKGHTWNFSKQSEMHNFFESPICMGSERLKGESFHPTQKPIRLLSHLIEIASNPSDVVLDPFMGVGSTGVATINLGRSFIGFEIEEKYYITAEARLANLSNEL